MKIDRLPGTTIALGEGQCAAGVIDSVTLGGGLVLSQVSSLTGLEGHMVQNWVKRGFVSPPEGKKYSKNQFCRVVLINFLRQTLQIDKIVGLIRYINGALDDEGDDIIGDAALYCCLTDALALLEPGCQDDPDAVDAAARAVAAKFQTDVPDGREKLANVLRVMMVLYTAAGRMECADRLMAQFEEVVPL